MMATSKGAMPIDQRGEATRLASGPARRDASVDRARSTGDAEAKASHTTGRGGAGEDDANRFAPSRFLVPGAPKGFLGFALRW